MTGGSFSLNFQGTKAQTPIEPFVLVQALPKSWKDWKKLQRNTKKNGRHIADDPKERNSEVFINRGLEEIRLFETKAEAIFA